jgi:hypothetical protein
VKNFGIFYLICVILLSVVPCSDEVEAGFATQQIENLAHGKQQGSAEACSPICLCACCGQSIIAPQQVQFEVRIPTVAFKKPGLTADFVCKQSPRSIWQPPKIVLNA